MFTIRNVQRSLLGFSLLLMVVSGGTCYFGVEHEINKISPETRAQMGDFDWVGIQWIERGGLIFMVAITAALAALVLWIIRRRRSGALLAAKETIV